MSLKVSDLEDSQELTAAAQRAIVGGARHRTDSGYRPRSLLERSSGQQTSWWRPSNVRNRRAL